jgi:outer membrane biosynthesis protein TonB
MGLFNFIETFFFISLGITFVLILLLVYHFKQRMSTLEQKGDTMFEIINNIVEELTSIKKELLKQTFETKPLFPQMPSFTLSTMSSPSEPVVSNISYQKLEPVVEEDNESDDDDDDDDDDSDDESHEGDDDDDYSFSDSEDDADHEVKEEEDNVILEDVLSDNEDSPLVEAEGKNIEEAAVPLTEDLDETDFTDEKQQPMEEQRPMEEPQPEKQEIESKETESKDTESKDTEEIADTSHQEETETEDKESYKKMTIHQLKTIVLAKGLSTDVGKLKKNELIRILESSHE